MTDASIKKATGKTWPQWFTLLDKLPKDATHTERARWLYEKYLPQGWWCQKVVVIYELSRGFRKKHQVVGGFQVSASKTLPISVNQLYQWWKNPTKRHHWLRSKLTITTAQPGKSVRIKWPDGSRVDVNLYAKGSKKSMVALQHEKLPNSRIAKQRQAWWKAQLEKLARVVA